MIFTIKTSAQVENMPTMHQDHVLYLSFHRDEASSFRESFSFKTHSSLGSVKLQPMYVN